MSDDEFVCEHCGASFDSENALRGHVNLQCDAVDGTDEDDGLDDEAWIERAQELRDQLEDVVDADDDDVTVMDEEPSPAPADAEEAHVQDDAQTKRTATADDVRAAIPDTVAEKLPEGEDLGSVKMIDEGGEPQMYIEIGGVLLPLQAEFDIRQEGDHTVIEAIDPHDTDTTIRLDEATPATEPRTADERVQTRNDRPDTQQTTADQPAPQQAPDLDAFSAKQELIDDIAETYDIKPDQLDDKPLEDLRRLKRRLATREEVKDELVHKYDVPEGQLVGKSLDELRQRKENEQQANELRGDLEERFGIDLAGDRRLDELEDYAQELEERKQQALEQLNRYGVELDDPASYSLEELEARVEEEQNRDELIEKIEGYAGLERSVLEDKDIETLQDLLEEKEKATELRSEIEENFDTEEDLRSKTLEELEDLKARLEEAEQLRDRLTQFYDVEMEEIADKDLDELRDLEDELEEIEDELHDVLGDHGIETNEEQEDEDPSTEGEDGVSDDQLDEMDFEDAEAPDPGESTQELQKGKQLLDDLGLEDIKDQVDVEDDDDEDEDQEETDDSGFLDTIREMFAGSTGSAGLQETTLSNMARVEDIEDQHDATVLLAHTLKQFLELKMGIGRELTYLEVIDALKEHGDELGLGDEDIEDLVRFFKRMHLQTYKGGQRVDLDASREMAEEYVRELT